jgi:multidrug transporter EmrE-like cation transporter
MRNAAVREEPAMSLVVLGLVLTTVVLTAISQVLLKLGMTSEMVQATMRSGHVANIMLAVVTSPLVVAGVACFGLAAVMWLVVLAQTPLSAAYPFVALGILVTVVAGIVVFGESVTMLKAIGVLAVVSGVILVGLGS